MCTAHVKWASRMVTMAAVPFIEKLTKDEIEDERDHIAELESRESHF